METITIKLSSKLAAKLETNISELGSSVGEYLTPIIEEHLSTERAMAERAWMPRGQWGQLLKGIDCPICRCLQDGAHANDEGYKVADLTIGQVHLMKNQFVKGYCVLYCTKHVREPYDLDQGDQAKFFDDLMRVGCALEKVFEPTKMNFEILGNATPHLHCHIKPRYYGDAAPGIPIDQNLYTEHVSEEEYRRRVDLIRAEV